MHYGVELWACLAMLLCCSLLLHSLCSSFVLWKLDSDSFQQSVGVNNVQTCFNGQTCCFNYASHKCKTSKQPRREDTQREGRVSPPLSCYDIKPWRSVGWPAVLCHCGGWLMALGYFIFQNFRAWGPTGRNHPGGLADHAASTLAVGKRRRKEARRGPDGKAAVLTHCRRVSAIDNQSNGRQRHYHWNALLVFVVVAFLARPSCPARLWGGRASRLLEPFDWMHRRCQSDETECSRAARRPPPPSRLTLLQQMHSTLHPSGRDGLASRSRHRRTGRVGPDRKTAHRPQSTTACRESPHFWAGSVLITWWLSNPINRILQEHPDATLSQL